MIFEPRLDTRHVKRVLTRAQSPDLFAVAEHRQTHGALVPDLLGMIIFAGIRRGGGRGVSISCVRRGEMIVGGRAAATAGGGGAAAAGRTWKSEEKSVYEGGNGDDCYDGED